MTEQTVLCITKGFDRTTRTPEILNETNDLSIGQVFNSVANFYGKIKEDYPRWISFGKNRGEFNVINERILECANDREKFNLVCDWLGEEPIS